MTQQPGDHALNFIYEEDPECQRIAESVAKFHQTALQCSDTYHSMMLVVVSAYGNLDVYICEHLERGSMRAISTFYPWPGTQLTRIEISRSAIEIQAGKIPKTQRSKVVGILAINYFIDCIRKALRLNAQEIRSKAARNHLGENGSLVGGRDGLQFQDEGDNSTLSGADGMRILEGSSADTFGLICEEIREHHVLLHYD